MRPKRTIAAIVLLIAAAVLQGCVVARATGQAVGGAVKTTGKVIGSAVK